MLDPVEIFLSQRRAEGLAAKSEYHYRRRLQRLVRRLQRMGLNAWQDVRTRDLEKLVDGLRAQGLSERTQQAEIVTTRLFFRWMVDQGQLLNDPARHLELPVIREDGPLLRPPLSEADMARLLAALPRRTVHDLRNVAHIELLYSAGLRLGESLALNLQDVDLESRVVHVRDGKGGKSRSVPMLGGLHSALHAYITQRYSLLQREKNALLLNQAGRRVTEGAFSKHIQKLNRLRFCGRKLHAHLFRHSIAVHLLRGGADIRYVQAFLGHDDLESTKVYLRLVPGDLRQAYDAAMPEIEVYPS